MLLAAPSAADAVFFDRTGLHTVFAETMRGIAVQTVLLDQNDVSTSMQRVAEAAVDVLLYLALPTEKFSYLLAHARWAPPCDALRCALFTVSL